MSIIIDEMTISDLEKIKEILQTEFDEFWTYSVFESELKNTNSKYFVAYENDEVVGFAGVTGSFDVAEIMNIVTKKDHRKKGIARGLLKKLIIYSTEQNYQKICLEVKANNVPAISLYEKNGFIKVGVRKNYYQNQIDAILMDLELAYI